MSSKAELLRQTLLNGWGYSDFRAEQLEICLAVLQKKGVMVCLATGAGKSLCYQVCAVVPDCSAVLALLPCAVCRSAVLYSLLRRLPVRSVI